MSNSKEKVQIIINEFSYDSEFWNKAISDYHKNIYGSLFEDSPDVKTQKFIHSKAGHYGKPNEKVGEIGRKTKRKKGK